MAERGLTPAADIAMRNLAAYADSCQTPPRALVEIDLDTSGAGPEGHPTGVTG